MQMYNDTSEAECWCSMSSQYKYSKQCMPKEIYGTPTLIEFEGRQYYAPEHYIDYLTRLYGDYMKLPTKEAQQANMDRIASFEL